MATAATSDLKKIVPRCGIQLSLVTPSCHQILLCRGEGEQSSWERWGLCWRGQCRFLANAQACWRQGGVLITGCMHFVKCRTINLGNYPFYSPSPRIALFALPSSRVPDQTNRSSAPGPRGGALTRTSVFLVFQTGRQRTFLKKLMTHVWATLHNCTSEV